LNLRYALALLVGVVFALVVSSIAPFDRGTWLLEVAPVLILIPVLLATYRKFQLTRLLYTLIFLHALVLIVGGAYSYARVPAGFWAEQVFHLSRNPYDKLGHFMQGFVPALAAREIFIRNRYVNGRAMTMFLCVCVAMAVSAVYELIEWLAALALGQGADAFLGTQGDPWDTQTDMAMALVGSVTALVLLARWHDREIAALARGWR
jgi:putative membrane protein